MTTNRSGFLFCILMMLIPFAALAEGQADHGAMASTDGFVVSASYGVALPGTVTVHLAPPDESKSEADAGTDWGLLGGRLGIGYAISGFRPELAFGYRTVPVSSVTLTKLAGSTEEQLLKPVNDGLKDIDWDDSAIASLDVVASVYYDIDTGTPIKPYIGAGGGVSQLSVTIEAKEENPLLQQYDVEVSSESVWAIAFQAAAGLGFGVFDGVTTNIGYRLTGTTEATLEESKHRIALAIGHHIELGLRYQF